MTNPMKCKCGQMPIKRDVYRNQKIDTQFRCDSCGISGPYNDPDHVGWDALVGGSSVAKEGTVRKAIQIGTDSEGIIALADDGTMWSFDSRNAYPWRQLPDLPTPAEAKGDVS